MATSSSLVADGHRRALAAVEEQVRAEVAAEFAERLKSASTFRRIRLEMEMRCEIKRRIEARVPRWALY